MTDRPTSPTGVIEPQSIRFQPDGPWVPLDLVRARDAGEVVFVVGAGASKGSGLPLFQELTRAVYQELSGADPEIPDAIPHADRQAYTAKSYDVALGLLEERIDGGSVFGATSRRRVREAVARALHADKSTRLDRHRHLLALSRDPYGWPRLVTTNFDTLFERAWPEVCGPSITVRSRANGNLPGPGSLDFVGILHLHGRLGDLGTNPSLEETDLVLTGADFGDAYLRSGWAARFLYDLVRRYHLVLVGYGAEDPPLKYLLNVISADRRRFTDLKSIYAFAETDGVNADADVSMWLAKGITPLLYESDHERRRLYDTLAEWAAAVEEPESWADRRFHAVARTPYDRSPVHDRSILSLLLTSSANCAKFKALGGHFSWVRAVEHGRSITRRGDARLLGTRAMPVPYIRAFASWMHERLDTPEAMAWAVERLAPRRTRPRLTGANTGTGVLDDAELVDLTEVHGFAPEEIAELERQFDHAPPTWPPACRRFWSLLLHVAHDLQRHDADKSAYAIVERLHAAGAEPDQADVRRLSRFLRPILRVNRPSRWHEEDPVQPFDPFTLASFSLCWKGYPEHRKIAAALPTAPEWLKSLLRAFDAEINRVYWLAGQIGWTTGTDVLSARIYRVATDSRWACRGAARDDDQDTDPDTYGSDHLALVRVTTAAWDKLADLDVEASHGVAGGWSLREEVLFQRLFLHTLTRQDVWSGADVGRALIGLGDEALWAGLPEATLLLVARWNSLPEADRAALEARLQAGPPPSLRRFVAAEEKDARRQEMAGRMLAAIAETGGILTAASHQLITDFHREIGADAAPRAIDNLLARGVRITTVPVGDASVFGDFQGERLLAMMEDLGGKQSLNDGDAVGALIRSEPDRVLCALVGADDGHAHDDLWRRLLWRLAEPDWIGAASTEKKANVLRAIARQLVESSAETEQAAVNWLRGVVIGESATVLPFLAAQQRLVLDAWTHLATPTLDGHGEETAFGANQGELLMTQALNTTAGVVAFIGLALADHGRREEEQLPLLAAARDVIEHRLLSSRGAARMLAAGRLAEWLHIAAQVLPLATEALVLDPLTSGEPEAHQYLSLLDLHALYGRGLTPDLYGRLQPLFLREAKASRLSGNAVARLVARLTWRMLDRLASRHDAAPEPSVMRAVLQQTSNEARIAAADAARNWICAEPLETRVTLWETVGIPFFDRVWPLDAALRAPELSEDLAQMSMTFGPAFPSAVEKILPLLVPYPVWDVGSIFLYADEPLGELRRTNNEEWWPLAADHWRAALVLVEAALGPAPSPIPYNLADWLKNLARLAPDALADQHYKRLLRLSQC